MANMLNELKIPAMVVIVISIVYLTALLGGENEKAYYPADNPQLFRRVMRQAREHDRRVAPPNGVEKYVYTDPDAAVDSEP